MLSSFITCFSGCHVFDEDEADAPAPAAAISFSTAADAANQPTAISTAAPMLAPSTRGMFAASHSNDTCSPVPSDGGSGEDIGSIIVAEKAVLSSPSRSLLDKTFVSSDESSQGDEEAGGFVKPLDVKDEHRRRMMMVAIGCFAAFLIVLGSILVGKRKNTPKNQSFLEIPVTMEPSSSPSSTPSTSPTTTNFPSLQPTSSPSNFPSLQPTSSPSAFPSAAPFVLFTYGESLYTDNDLGIQISVGLTARQIAQSGSRVRYANGERSSRRYHGMMDGAGIAQLLDGGYAYLSNAEEPDGDGGVFGLYFNKDGKIIDYKALLTGTSRNCGGGMSPWNTWISCEEVGGGQCWQVEPNPDSPNHNSPKATLLGGRNGGEYETVAVDNTNESKPVFFVTEDLSDGELRRFEADGNGWDALHVGGRTTYLQFLSGNRFRWTSNIEAAKYSAASHYPNTEGIIYHNSTLYFVAKVTRTLFILDLNDMTYTSELTGSSLVGQGAFNSQPDQIIESDLDERKYLYFSEDGGSAPGVHVRDREGKYYTMARGVPGGRYSGDESVGIAFSPDRRKFYFGFQDAGVLIEVSRDDGHKFN